MDSQIAPVPPIKPHERRMFIYFLRCPITNAVRYVGCTRDIKWRKKAHCYGEEPRTAKWVRELRNQHGLKPMFEVIEQIIGVKEAQRRESELIREWRTKANLLNVYLLK